MISHTGDVLNPLSRAFPVSELCRLSLHSFCKSDRVPGLCLETVGSFVCGCGCHKVASNVSPDRGTHQKGVSREG